MIDLRSTSPAEKDEVRDGNGFTLLELVITITILTILTLGAVPLARTGVQRQKEQQLRETLREMRIAIDQFHREAIAAPLTPPTTTGQQQQQNGPPNPLQNPLALDPRVRVYVSDQTIFTVDNIDRYPPSLELLGEGVDVLPFATPQQLMGGMGLGNTKPLSEQEPPVAKKKFYLRTIPIDPITGERSWDPRSCYQSPDDTSWDGINVFDVHSKAKGTALNGEKYSDW
jgi:general secretion pathway protein G